MRQSKNKSTRIGLWRRPIQLAAIVLLIFIPWVNDAGFRTIIGNYSSLRIGELILSMPMEALEVIFASSHGYVPLIISTLVPIFLTLLLGPVFCSWICPHNSFCEICDLVYRKLHLQKNGFSVKSRWFILPFLLIPVVLGIDALWGVTLFSAYFPSNMFSRVCISLAFLGTVTLEVVWIGALLCVEMFAVRRAWCRYVCPLGALLSLIGFPRLLKIRFNRKACNNCLECLPACPLGTDPRNASIRCRNCGTCVVTCSKDALGMSFFSGRKS